MDTPVVDGSGGGGEGGGGVGVSGDVALDERAGAGVELELAYGDGGAGGVVELNEDVLSVVAGFAGPPEWPAWSAAGLALVVARAARRRVALALEDVAPGGLAPSPEELALGLFRVAALMPRVHTLDARADGGRPRPGEGFVGELASAVARPLLVAAARLAGLTALVIPGVVLPGLALAALENGLPRLRSLDVSFCRTLVAAPEGAAPAPAPRWPAAQGDAAEAARAHAARDAGPGGGAGPGPGGGPGGLAPAPPSFARSLRELKFVATNLSRRWSLAWFSELEAFTGRLPDSTAVRQLAQCTRLASLTLVDTRLCPLRAHPREFAALASRLTSVTLDGCDLRPRTHLLEPPHAPLSALVAGAPRLARVALLRTAAPRLDDAMMEALADALAGSRAGADAGGDGRAAWRRGGVGAGEGEGGAAAELAAPAPPSAAPRRAGLESLVVDPGEGVGAAGVRAIVEAAGTTLTTLRLGAGTSCWTTHEWSRESTWGASGGWDSRNDVLFRFRDDGAVEGEAFAGRRRGPRVDDACLAALGSGCSALSSLGLPRALGVTDAGLRAFAAARGARAIAALDISRAGVHEGATLDALERGLPRLRELRIVGCHAAASGSARGAAAVARLRARGATVVYTPPVVALAAVTTVEAGNDGADDDDGAIQFDDVELRAAVRLSLLQSAAGAPLAPRGALGDNVPALAPPAPAPPGPPPPARRPCIDGCGALLLAGDEADHAYLCGRARVRCPLARDGCAAPPLPRAALAAHYFADCAGYHVVCRQCPPGAPAVRAAALRAHAAGHAVAGGRADARARRRCPFVADGCAFMGAPARGGSDVMEHVAAGACAAAGAWPCALCGAPAPAGARRGDVCAGARSPACAALARERYRMPHLRDAPDSAAPPAVQRAWRAVAEAAEAAAAAAGAGVVYGGSVAK